MNAASKSETPVFADTLLQRMIVCDSSARWLGAVRGAVDESQRRSIVPALDFQDAVRQSMEANQAIIVLYVSSENPQKAIEQICQCKLDPRALLFAVCEPELVAWQLALVEAGCARVFGGLLQLDNLMKSASQFFSVQPPVRFSWQQQLQDRMPWPAWSTEKDPVSNS